MLTYLFQIAVASVAFVFSSVLLLGDLSRFKSRQRTSSVTIYYLHCVPVIRNHLCFTLLKIAV